MGILMVFHLFFRDDYRDDNDDISYQATAYALEILGDYYLL
ncbi:unnamed protein product, partial [marine sediment metagenome]